MSSSCITRRPCRMLPLGILKRTSSACPFANALTVSACGRESRRAISCAASSSGLIIIERPSCWRRYDSLAVIRVAHARNRRQLAARLFGNRAAEQIQLIRAGDGNHQIGLLKPCFLQHAEARAVALNPHHVEHIRRVAHHALVCIHNGDIVPFAHKLLGQRMADLAAAHNNDAQALHLFLRRFDLHGFLPPPSSIVFRQDDTMFSSLLYRLYPALSMRGAFLIGFLAVGQPDWLDAPAGSAYNKTKCPVRAEYKFRFG